MIVLEEDQPNQALNFPNSLYSIFCPSNQITQGGDFYFTKYFILYAQAPHWENEGLCQSHLSVPFLLCSALSVILDGPGFTTPWGVTVKPLGAHPDLLDGMGPKAKQSVTTINQKP